MKPTPEDASKGVFGELLWPAPHLVLKISGTRDGMGIDTSALRQIKYKEVLSMRPTAEKRHNDYVKAIRKRRIDRETSPLYWNHDWYDNLHQYSKNKIHCSCPWCTAKTNNRGRYGSRMNWCVRDRRQLDEMDYDEEELDFE